MVKTSGEGEILRCSFCNKDQHDVRKLIAGPTVFICDECVAACNDIIVDDERFEARKRAAETSSLPEQPPVEHPTIEALMDRVVGLCAPDQWLLVMDLFESLEGEIRYHSDKRRAETLSSPSEPPSVGDAALAAISQRTAQLSSSDRWLLVMHLLARLRTPDVTVGSGNST
jgi:hypothetical protein